MNSSERTINRRAFLATLAAAPVAFSALTPGVSIFAADGPPASENCLDLASVLSPIRERSNLPALAAAACKGGHVVAAGAVGVRKVGATAEVTVDDKFHIGSCTKAMTATLAAMYVEEKKLAWDRTLAEFFPERAAKMHEDYRKVTLRMLLTHRAGMPANSNDYGPSSALVTVQRLAYLDSIINAAPAHAPGTKFSYSNAGYIVTGTILERIAGISWEEILQRRLFKPLGMTSTGFGPPSKPNATDQPWGHILKDSKFQPRYGDNHRALGPAGTVHCSVRDYLKFADFHASNGARPGGLLSPASFETLHTPAEGQDYAMGWGTAQRTWAQGTALTHNGSNTMNFFVVWIAPKSGFSIAVASNAASDNVPKALDDVAAALVKKFAA